MLAFFLVVYALWMLLHVYAARCLIRPSGLGRWARRTVYAVFALCAVSTPLAPFSSWLAPPYHQLRWPAWIYIGAFTILVALLVTRDLSWWALGWLDRVRARRGQSTVLPRSPERRQFLLRATSNAAVGVTGALAGYGLYAARRAPEVVEVEVPIEGLPHALDGYHIVQLSDVHVGETIDKDFILPIIETVTSLAPDMIALTGDLVDGSVPQLQADISPLAYLRARDGVFCVTGNHEYYSGVLAWIDEFRRLGLTVLINENVIVERGGARLLLAGVTDKLEGKKVPGHTSDPKRALEDAPAHDVRVLLAHQPRSIYDASPLGYHLQLSGHTHGGQFFPWNLFIGLVQPLGSGLAKFGETWLYVNRGTCYWGPPNRAGVRAEITSLRLRRV